MVVQHHIADGVEGPARVIVPISENPVTKAVFNAVARHELDDPCERSEEIVAVWQKMHGPHRERIHDALESYGEVDPTDEEAVQSLSEHVREHL